jgi:hypothetical protein
MVAMFKYSGNTTLTDNHDAPPLWAKNQQRFETALIRIGHVNILIAHAPNHKYTT